MEEISEDIASVLCKRVYDIAGTTRGIRVHLNGTPIKVKSFLDYVKLYPMPEGVVYAQQKTAEWEVICVPSGGQFQQASFVNSICTIKGGTHVTYVTDQIVQKVAEGVKKKAKIKEIKGHIVRNQLFVFVNCTIVNPSFDSQSKEVLNLKASKFGSVFAVSESFINKCMCVDW
jgi:DNA topoisomerase-2